MALSEISAQRLRCLNLGIWERGQKGSSRYTLLYILDFLIFRAFLCIFAGSAYLPQYPTAYVDSLFGYLIDTSELSMSKQGLNIFTSKTYFPGLLFSGSSTFVFYPISGNQESSLFVPRPIKSPN